MMLPAMGFLSCLIFEGVGESSENLEEESKDKLEQGWDRGKEGDEGEREGSGRLEAK